MEAERREKLRRGIIEQGPSAATMRFYALLVQTRAAVANACVFLHNALVGWAVGHRQYVTPGECAQSLRNEGVAVVEAAVRRHAQLNHLFDHQSYREHHRYHQPTGSKKRCTCFHQLPCPCLTHPLPLTHVIVAGRCSCLSGFVSSSLSFFPTLTEMPLNLPEILTTLMDVHGHQMFHDGACVHMCVFANTRMTCLKEVAGVSAAHVFCCSFVTCPPRASASPTPATCSHVLRVQVCSTATRTPGTSFCWRMGG